MTAYFDDVQRKLMDVDLDQLEAMDQLREIELEVINECALTVMQPDFPEEYRKAIVNHVTLRGIATQPINIPAKLVTDFETVEQHKNTLQSFITDLHTWFHNVARDRDTPYSDNPRAGRVKMQAEFEEACESRAEEISGE